MGIKNIDVLTKWDTSPDQMIGKDTETMGVTEFEDGPGDENVPHENKVDDAVDAELKRLSSVGAIAAVSTYTGATIADAAAPGASYVQAEHTAMRTELVALNAARIAADTEINALRTALNSALTVLRDAELIPSS